MFTNSYRDDVLNVYRATTLNSITGFAGLLTGITDFRAGTVTEASYTGYGTRPSITFSAPANTSPVGGRQIANSSTVTFPQNTGSSQDMIAFGVYTASTAGTLKAIGFLSPDPPVFGTGDDTSELITAPAHGFVTDQRVFVIAVPGAPIPTGLSENTAYFVKSAGLTADVFSLATTSGGAAINITVKGAALFMSYIAVTVAASATPEFAANALVLQI